MRNLPRFRIRTILIVMAIVAALITIVPGVVWRCQFESSLDAAIEGKLGRDSDWLYLKSNRSLAIERMNSALTSDISTLHKLNAFNAMRKLGFPKEYQTQALSELIDIADTFTVNSYVGTQHYEIAHQLPKFISDSISSVGLTDGQRKRLYDLADQNLTQVRNPSKEDWLLIIAAMGGKEELQLLERFFHTFSTREKHVACNILIRQMDEALLPSVERWLLDLDAEVASQVLEFGVLSLTKSGRRTLVQFAKDTANDPKLRVKAIQQLLTTIAGIEVLESACSDQTIAKELSALLGMDCLSSCTAQRAVILSELYGDSFWTELIDGLDPKYFSSLGSELAIEKSKLSFEILQRLTGHQDFVSQSQWREWLAEQNPTVRLREILEAVLERPDFLESSAVLRRMIPYHLADIPEDCLPLYQQMLRSNNPALKYWSCKAILQFSDSAEAIEVAVGLIEVEKRNPSRIWRSGVITLLQERFGVNYFWDIDAWREWAKNRRDAKL